MLDQRGQMIPLAAGLTAVVLAVIGIGTDMTRLFLARRSLQSVADAASLQAADTLDTGSLYGSDGDAVRIDIERAREAALRVIAQRGLKLNSSVEVDRRSVTVILRSSIGTGLLGLIGFETLPVAVTSTGIPVEGVPDQGIQPPAPGGR
jgi:uncharacterized membrane protein